MGIIIFSIFLIMVGVFCIWMAIFSKKKDLKEFASDIPTDLSDFFILIIYKLFPPIIRRIFLFLAGIGVIALAIFILFT